MKHEPVCYLCGAVGQHEVGACPLRKWLLGVGLACAIGAACVDANHVVTVLSFGTLVVMVALELDPRAGVGSRDWPAWLQWWTLACIFAGMAQALAYCTGVTR
jgi:hypothetical protein